VTVHRHGHYSLKEKHVPKLKTNRGAAKRFKKTGTGKIKAKRAFASYSDEEADQSKARSQEAKAYREGVLKRDREVNPLFIKW